MGFFDKAKQREDAVVSNALARRRQRTGRSKVAHKLAERCPESGVMRPNCPHKARKSDPTCQC